MPIVTIVVGEQNAKLLLKKFLFGTLGFVYNGSELVDWSL